MFSTTCKTANICQNINQSTRHHTKHSKQYLITLNKAANMMNNSTSVITTSSQPHSFNSMSKYNFVSLLTTTSVIKCHIISPNNQATIIDEQSI